MQIIQTVSSNVSRYAWDGITLFIEFAKNRATYAYDNVPESVYDAMLAAPSVGEFFHSDIKKAFVCVKVVADHAQRLGFDKPELVSNA